jgi:hypothetical protein
VCQRVLLTPRTSTTQILFARYHLLAAQCTPVWVKNISVGLHEADASSTLSSFVAAQGGGNRRKHMLVLFPEGALWRAGARGGLCGATTRGGGRRHEVISPHRRHATRAVAAELPQLQWRNVFEAGPNYSTNSLTLNESARRAGDDSARCAGDEGRNQRACGSECGRGRREER